MNNRIADLVHEYGRLAGISIDNIGNNQIRYRFKEIYGTPGIWISERKAKAILDNVGERVNQEVQRRFQERKTQLEDAFGPDGLVNPFELGILLRYPLKT